HFATGHERPYAERVRFPGAERWYRQRCVEVHRPRRRPPRTGRAPGNVRRRLRRTARPRAERPEGPKLLTSGPRSFRVGAEWLPHRRPAGDFRDHPECRSRFTRFLESTDIDERVPAPSRWG